MDERFYTTGAGGGLGYGVYDREGGSSPVLTSGYLAVAERVARLLNYFAAWSPDSFDQAEIYEVWQDFLSVFGEPK